MQDPMANTRSSSNQGLIFYVSSVKNIPCLGLIMQSNVIYYSRQVSLFGPHHAIGNCLVYYTLQLSLFGRHHFPFLGLIMQLFDLLNFKLPSLGLIMPSFCLLTFNFPSLGLIMPLVVVPNLNFPFLGSSYT